MGEREPGLRLYSPDDQPESEFSSSLEARKFIRTLINESEHDESTAENIGDYLEKNKKECDEYPKSDSDHLRLIFNRTRRAAAVDKYLIDNGVNPHEEQIENSAFREVAMEKVVAFAGAEQSVVALAVKHANDPDFVSDIVYYFALSSHTPFGGSVENVRQIIETKGMEKSEEYEKERGLREKVLGACRGVAGHIAAVNIFKKRYPDLKPHAPNAVLDSWGLDFAMCSDKSSRYFEQAIQVKGRMNTDKGIKLQTTDGGDQGIEVQKLQKIIETTRRRNNRSVSLEIKGILIELRGMEDWSIDDETSGFDIFSGMCNNALLLEAEQVFREVSSLEKKRTVHMPGGVSPLGKFLKKQAS